ncbi:cobalamin biosynthesis protein [Eleftheria terrae]|uniref:cobalamin biosynthesis protein n=1 Tax=Eleftheria terrae TaxID=1597781 RepID=UPI00263AF9C9|nr:cobalamin biosynthesis protein [Eleftheria terrae]WKB53581.1 cobalamin biosynthesis protein [Eleftheria terrae]
MSSFSVAVGLGCDRGTPLATVRTAIEQALRQAGLQWGQVAVLATIDAKADEPAFLQLAEALARPLHFYPAEALARVPVPNPSATVLRFMGTPSVSEAAALLAAETDTGSLLVEKHRYRGSCGRNATVSLARVRAGAAHDTEHKERS